MIGSLALMSLVMAAAWLLQRVTKNCGWVDVCWSYGVGLAAALAALSVHSPRHLLVLATIAIWALRLGSSIATRTRGGHEDQRYAKFRREWGSHFEIRMFGFLQIQALAAWPLLFAIHAAAAGVGPLGWHDAFAIAVALFAIGGEALADLQLRQFRATHRNDSVCDAGLWHVSRHPNYFFEFLGWCALPCFAFAAGTAMLVACLAPVSIYVLLVYVSGIPPLEAHMLASRGDKFRAYQARTSAFFPWPPSEPTS